MKRCWKSSQVIREEKGSMLILTILVIAVLTQASAVIISKTLAEARLSEIQQKKTELFYLSEGAMEAAIAQFRSDVANFQVDPLAPQYPVAGNIQTNFSPTARFPAGASANSVFTEAETVEGTYNDPEGVEIR